MVEILKKVLKFIWAFLSKKLLSIRLKIANKER